MDKKEILDSLIDKVSQLQDATKALDVDLQALDTAIKNDNIIPNEINSRVREELSSLEIIKHSCFEDYNLFSDDSFPETFTDLRVEMEKFQVSLDKNKYIEAKQFLLRLDMNDTVARKLYDAIKDDLRAIDINELSAEECEHVFSDYIMLKKAFEANTEMEKTICIMNIGTTYPAEIVQAALFGKYSVSESDNIQGTDSITNTDQSIIMNEKDHAVEAEESEEIRVDSNKAAEMVEALLDNNDNEIKEGKTERDNLISGESVEESVESDSAVIMDYYGKSLDEIYTLLVDDESETEEVKVYESEQANKPFSVKKFLSALPHDKALQRNIGFILDRMTWAYGITEDIISFTENITIDEFNSAIDFLYKKGYVRFCELQGLPRVYTPTEKGQELYNSPKIKAYSSKLYKPNYFAIDADAKDTAFYKLIVICNWIYQFFQDEEANQTAINRCAFIDYAKSEKSVYVSAIPADKDEFGRFLVAFASDFLTDKEVKQIQIVAMTDTQARDLANIISLLKDSTFSGGLPEMTIRSYLDKSKETINTQNNYQKDSLDKELEADNTAKEITQNNASNSITEIISEDAGDDSNEESIEDTVSSSEKVDETDDSTMESSVIRKAVQYINNDRLYCATAMCMVTGRDNKAISAYYNRLAYAVDDPIMHCYYDSQTIMDLFSDELNTEESYYQVAAVLRNYFSNDQPYDYQIQQLHNVIKDNLICKDNPKVDALAFALFNFKSQNKAGADKYADYRSNDRMRYKNDLTDLRNKASVMYEKHVNSSKVPIQSKRHKRFEQTYWLIFDEKESLAFSLDTVKNDNIDNTDYISDWLNDTFIKKGKKIASQNISPELIEKYMDENWKKADEAMSLEKHSSPLMDPLRSQLSQIIKSDLEIVCDWVRLHQEYEPEHDDAYDYYESNKNKLQEIADDALKNVRKHLEKVKDSSSKAGLRVLLRTIDEICRKLKGTYSLSEHKYFYADFLRTNYVMVDHSYMPELSQDIPLVKGMELTERIRKHANSKNIPSYADYLNEYCEDNYGTSRLIINFLKEITGSEPEIVNTIDEAERQASTDFNTNVYPGFVNNLELRQSYGQLDEDDGYKERILDLVGRWKIWADETHNYGFVRSLISNIVPEIEEKSIKRGEETTKQLEAMIASNKDFAAEHEDYIDSIRNVINDQNYLVAEDMMNHFYSKDVSDDSEYPREDYLADFLRQYDGIYKRIGTSGQNLSSFIRDNDINKLKTRQDQKEAKILKTNWPGQSAIITQEKLQAILKSLGFDVKSITLVSGNIHYFTVKLAKPPVESIDSYGHPIHAFGSKATLQGFRVVWMPGLNSDDDIMDKCNALGMTRNTLIFADCKLQIDQKRALARKMKKAGASYVCAVIDRVLYMYLVCNYSRAKIRKMLMETMMPYAYYQPYVYDSATIMPPEMFIGRKDELESIKNPEGANIVFGGRQLGKSALLRKAKIDIDYDTNGDRAVLIDIKGLDYQKTAQKIAETLFDEKIIKDELPATVDWSDISRALKKALNNVNTKINYLLLMLDEADYFIDSCESVNYSPFDQLKDVQLNVDPGRFKFVVAGLRNVMRFKNDMAVSNNSVLMHLDSITVMPFKTQDAKMLLEEPLYYLGFRFNDEKTHLVPMIMATANYFPGLIQMYCAKLIETLKDQYAGYNENDTPPYDVNEELIQKVLADSDFQEQIRNKFMMTLKMGDDDFYYILALIIAYLNRSSTKGEGCSAEDILQVAQEFNTKRFNQMSIEQINALLIEMCEMNILRMTFENGNNSKYLFSRYNYNSMMGNQKEIEDQLVEYMEED